MEILIRAVPTTKSIVDESCVKTYRAVKLIADVCLYSNHVYNCIYYRKGCSHSGANHLVKDILADFWARNIAVSQNET